MPSARSASLTRLDVDNASMPVVRRMSSMMRRFAVGAFLHRSVGAVKDNEIGAGVGERACRVRDLVGQFGDGFARLAGDPAARDEDAEAIRCIMVELRLGHPIDRRDDQADARAGLRQFGDQAILFGDGVHFVLHSGFVVVPDILARRFRNGDALHVGAKDVR